MSEPPRSGVGLAALLALPVVLLAVHPDGAFGGLRRDAQEYFTGSAEQPGYLGAYDGRLSEGRLSVLLPGWVAYRLLPPWWANAGLHLAAYWLAVLAAHYALRRAVGPRAAWLAAGCCAFSLRGGGGVADWTAAYALLCFALLARAAGPGRWRGWLVAAGVAGSAVVVADLRLVLLLPAFAGFYVLLDRRGLCRPLDAAAFWFAAGFAGVLIGLNFLGWQFFCLDTVAAVTYLARQWTQTSGATAPVVLPVREWLREASWLALPAAAAVGAVAAIGVWLVRRRRGQTPPALTVYLQCQLLALLAAAGLLQLLRCEVLLQSSAAGSPLLLPAALLALAAQWQGWLDALRPEQFRRLAVVAFLGLAAAVVLPAPTAVPLRYLAALTAVAAVAVVLTQLPGAGLRFGVPAVALLCAAHLGMAAGGQHPGAEVAIDLGRSLGSFGWGPREGANHPEGWRFIGRNDHARLYAAVEPGVEHTLRLHFFMVEDAAALGRLVVRVNGERLAETGRFWGGPYHIDWRLPAAVTAHSRGWVEVEVDIRPRVAAEGEAATSPGRKIALSRVSFLPVVPDPRRGVAVR